jgi:hypothetical protein
MKKKAAEVNRRLPVSAGGPAASAVVDGAYSARFAGDLASNPSS